MTNNRSTKVAPTHLLRSNGQKTALCQGAIHKTTFWQTNRKIADFQFQLLLNAITRKNQFEVKNIMIMLASRKRSCFIAIAFLGTAIASAIADRDTSSAFGSETRRLDVADDTCQDDEIGYCMYNMADGVNYYKDCGSMEMGYIFFREKDNVWCYSDDLKQDICCGEAQDCCQPIWWLAGVVFLLGSMLISCCLWLVCGFLGCLCCCRSSSRQRRRGEESDSGSSYKGNGTDKDEEGSRDI